MDDLMKDIEKTVKPYRGEFPAFDQLPATPRSREEILQEMRELEEREDKAWKDGYVSGAVYHGDSEHIQFLNQVYSLTSQYNPLHADLWPSNVKYEAEIVEMTANMLGKENTPEIADPERDKICGVVTSGGTESILLAMKTYRDYARKEKGITDPEMLVPETVHAAFDKASEYFNIRIRRIPLDSE
ncbi:MAG: aspartate aminotransferase family protein, partial [Thermodesulfobacteriota bacterium]